MDSVLGFGNGLVTLVWALSMLVVLAWTIWQFSRRRLVTILSFVVLWTFFLPVILQYPFTFGGVNAAVVGPTNYLTYLPFVDGAFLISLAGLIVAVVSYLLVPNGDARFGPASFVRAGLRIWSNRVFLYLTSIMNLLLFFFLSALGLLGPEGLRNLAQQTPALRPIYNIAHTLLPLTVALTLLVGWERRRWSLLFLASANLLLGVLTGSRSAVFTGVLFFGLAVLGYASLRSALSPARVLRMVPVVGLLFLFALYLGDIREGQYNPLVTLAGAGIRTFYGNNFSDLRDFAWLKSYWDGELYLGKTMLAGLMAFIPSFISPFRSEWNWGVVSTSVAGLDPSITPGLRVGIFGETYFNFGLPGVIVVAFVYGYVLRRLHRYTQAEARRRDPFEAKLGILAGFLTLTLFSNFLATAGFFGFYLTVFTLAALMVIKRAIRPRRGVPLAGDAALSPTK